MTTYKVRLDTRELRGALMSVLPHTSKDFPPLDRIRVYTAPPTTVVVAATDRFTAAMVSLDTDDQDGEVGCFDIFQQDVREVLTLFKPGPEEEHVVELLHDGKSFTVTDVSGMFPGKHVRFEGITTSDFFPDVARLIRETIRTIRPGQMAIDPDRTGYTVTASAWPKFVAAAKAMGMPLSVEPSTAELPAVLVTCGASFIGLIAPYRRDEEAEADFRETRWHWSGLAKAVSEAHPMPPDVRRAREAQPVVDLAAELAVDQVEDEEETDGDA